jgi:GDP-L-fucose synthase
MYKGSKIYVAGHTGLLGSALIKKLKHKGSTRVITRTHAELDLTDKASVFEFFSGQRPECVFLAAGKVGVILSNKAHPAEYLYVNLCIQNNVFEAAQQSGVERLIFYGSSCAYPKDCQQPMKEEHFLTGLIEETSQGYAAAKIAGIIVCRVYNQQYGTNRFIALVPNTMYGPNDNFDPEDCHVLPALISRFHKAKIGNSKSVTLWGTGKPRREFIFSEDVAEASLFALENVERLRNTHFNVGSGTDYSIRELATIIALTVGYNEEIIWDKSKPDGANQKLLGSSKFCSLGWKPTVDLEAGLQRTYQWFKEQYSAKQ